MNQTPLHSVGGVFQRPHHGVHGLHVENLVQDRVLEGFAQVQQTGGAEFKGNGNGAFFTVFGHHDGGLAGGGHAGAAGHARDLDVKQHLPCGHFVQVVELDGVRGRGQGRLKEINPFQTVAEGAEDGLEVEVVAFRIVPVVDAQAVEHLLSRARFHVGEKVGWDSNFRE